MGLTGKSANTGGVHRKDYSFDKAIPMDMVLDTRLRQASSTVTKNSGLERSAQLDLLPGAEENEKHLRGKSRSGNRVRGLVNCTSHGVADIKAARGILDTTTRRTRSPCSVSMYINNNNPNVMDVDSSRTIVEDYVRYRLESNGLTWQNGQRDVTPNEIQRAMRALGDEFESRFSQAFDDMINQLHITPDTAYQTFRTIVNEIFSDGVNWGRVVALFGFGGKLAVRCVQQSMPQLVSSIVDWVSTYVDTTLQSWISANNGWAGFLEFYEGGPEKRTKESWPSLKTICSYAAAGLGILTLGAFLSQKS